MKQALVTGGSLGLGRALTAELRRRGFAVHVLDVVPPATEPSAGLTFHELDLGALGRGDAPALPEGPVFDVVILNAGITWVGDFVDTPTERDRRVLEVNALGHIALVKELLRAGRLADGGHLALTVSASVHVPWPVALAYAASKGALDGFALALESYLAPRRVSVTRVYPGPMRTNHGGYAQATGRRVGVEPEAIAPRIVRAILRRRRRLFPDLAGRVLSIGCRLLPRTAGRLIQRRLASVYFDSSEAPGEDAGAEPSAAEPR